MNGAIADELPFIDCAMSHSKGKGCKVCSTCARSKSISLSPSSTFLVAFSFLLHSLFSLHFPNFKSLEDLSHLLSQSKRAKRRVICKVATRYSLVGSQNLVTMILKKMLEIKRTPSSSNFLNEHDFYTAHPQSIYTCFTPPSVYTNLTNDYEFPLSNSDTCPNRSNQNIRMSFSHRPSSHSCS